MKREYATIIVTEHTVELHTSQYGPARESFLRSAHFQAVGNVLVDVSCSGDFACSLIIPERHE